MSKIKKYIQLEKKAESYRFKQDGVCCEMLDLINPMLSFPMPFEEQFVMYQIGDGYVLVTNEYGSKNTPVDKIIQWYESTGELVDENILHTLSI